MAMTKWTPPASDHELNKRLADAIGLEVEKGRLPSSDYNEWIALGGVWSPATDWNQAMRCAEMAVSEGLHWSLNPNFAEVEPDLRLEFMGVSDLPSYHDDNLLLAFCHVILQALES